MGIQQDSQIGCYVRKMIYSVHIPRDGSCNCALGKQSIQNFIVRIKIPVVIFWKAYMEISAYIFFSERGPSF